MTQACDTSDWIEWRGGECPVDPKTPVVAQLVNESRRTAEGYGARPAGFWNWKPTRTKARVIAYRVVKS